MILDQYERAEDLLAACVQLHRAGLQHLVIAPNDVQVLAMAEAGDVVALQRIQMLLDEVGMGLGQVAIEGRLRGALRQGIKEVVRAG